MNNIDALLSHVKLRLNIEHPTYEDCYIFGYECADAGLNEEENPFRNSSSESEQWSEGWWDGFYGEEPLFSLEISVPRKELDEIEDEPEIEDEMEDSEYVSSFRP